MKIIHVEDYFDPTAGYQVNELLFAHKNYSDELYLITSNSLDIFYKNINLNLDREFEEKTGVKIIRLDILKKISGRVILKDLYTTINSINPNIVFYHGIGDFKDLLLFKKKQKYKIVRDCHMSWVASENKYRKLFYMFFRLFFAPIINYTEKYHTIYALGEEEKEYLIKLGIKNNKIELLPHGYNEETVFYDKLGRDLVRKKYGINKNQYLISYIGKFDYKKRPDLIFDILEKVPEEKLKDAVFLFMGPKKSEYMKEFNEKLNKFSFNNRVIIDEAKPFFELKNYYSASDICIFPKETSLSSIHAQVCGSLVVMENEKSNIERVILNDHLYNPNDFNSAAGIIEQILNNKELFFNSEYKRESYKALQNRSYRLQIEKFKIDLD